MFLIISGPSGAGQDSVIEELAKHRAIERVITTTTREMRPGETEGKPYYFISKKAFEQGIEAGYFFEYAMQDRGHYYGVTHEEIHRVEKSSKLGVWKMDYQGVLFAKEHLPKDGTVAVLIWAPLEVLAKRLRQRENGEDEAFIEKRLAYAKGWFENRGVFDYEVENLQGKLQETVSQVEAIILQEWDLDKK